MSKDKIDDTDKRMIRIGLTAVFIHGLLASESFTSGNMGRKAIVEAARALVDEVLEAEGLT
jgi:hypothetical protein